MAGESRSLTARGVYRDLPFTVSRRNYLWRRAMFRGRNDRLRYHYSQRVLRRLAKKASNTWTSRESREHLRATWFLEAAPRRQCSLQLAGLCNGGANCPFHHTPASEGDSLSNEATSISSESEVASNEKSEDYSVTASLSSALHSQRPTKLVK